MSTALARPREGTAAISPRAGRLAVASVATILVASLVAAVGYTGTEGESYSPLNHYISELGQLSVSRLAAVFNAGLIAGAIGLTVFILLVARALPPRYGIPFALVGLVSGTGGSLVGIFPMDYLSTHRLVAFTFFLTGWILVLIFSTWQIRTADARFPRWILAEAGLVVASFLAFIASMSTVKQSDTLVAITNRPGFWAVTALEWLALLSLLAWFALVGLAIASATPRMDGRPDT